MELWALLEDNAPGLEASWAAGWRPGRLAGQKVFQPMTGAVGPLTRMLVAGSWQPGWLAGLLAGWLDCWLLAGGWRWWMVDGGLLGLLGLEGLVLAGAGWPEGFAQAKSPAVGPTNKNAGGW